MFPLANCARPRMTTRDRCPAHKAASSPDGTSLARMTVFAISVANRQRLRHQRDDEGGHHDVSNTHRGRRPSA